MRFIKMTIKAFLGFLERQYEHMRTPGVPKDLTPHVMGYSHQQKEIVCYRIGTGALPVLFVSAIHGNEVGTISFAYQLLAWLKVQPAVFSTFTFFIVPCLNPDGRAVATQHPDYLHGGREGRVNARAVDLNRNFPTNSFQSQAFWLHGKNYAEETTVFAGSEGGSEPESQAIISLITKEQIKLVLSFHNAGRDVTGSVDLLGQELATLYAQKSGYRFFSQEEWLALGQTGTMKEWCEEQSISYLEVESSSRWGSDWQCQKPAVAALLERLQRH